MSFNFTVNAGNHDRDCCPVRVKIPEGCGISSNLLLTDDSGKKIPAQYEGLSKGESALSLILYNLKAGEERHFTVEPGKTPDDVTC